VTTRPFFRKMMDEEHSEEKVVTFVTSAPLELCFKTTECTGQWTDFLIYDANMCLHVMYPDI